MVERTECFITKFGSIHKTEAEAKEAEKQEEKDDFSRAYCDLVNLEHWGHPYETAAYIYNHRHIIKQLLDTYKFIQ
jgi:hypothetical protein